MIRTPDGGSINVAGTLTAADGVTLTGSGGVGKTRLALRVAGSLGGTLDQGARWTELAAASEPEHVTMAVAKATGVWSALDQLCADARMRK